MFSDLTMKSEFHIAAAATGWRLEVERKNSSDEHILIVLVTQSYYATSDDSWPLTFDPSGHFKEGIQEKNSHNRPDCSKAIDSVGDGRAVEYYFASDARSDTNCLWVLWWIWGQIIKFLSFFVIVLMSLTSLKKDHLKRSQFITCIHLICTHSAIIEHTNKVLYMEDDDIAVVTSGKLSIHRVNRQAGEDPVRAIQTLQMELQQIMKGQTMVQKTILFFGLYEGQ